MDFSDWLREEIYKRNLNNAKLARLGGVTTAQISRIVAGTRGAGPDVCIAIAKGLQLPREEVFRARGWLLAQPEDPYGPEIDPRAEQLAKKVSQMPLETREVTLKAMEAVLNSAHELKQIFESPAEYEAS